MFLFQVSSTLQLALRTDKKSRKDSPTPLFGNMSPNKVADIVKEPKYDTFASVPTDSSGPPSEDDNYAAQCYTDMIEDTMRAPMNQEQYDKIYGYRKPDHPHPVMVRKLLKFSKRYTRPFQSPMAFLDMILSFVPFIKWFPRYPWSQNLAADIIGGCTMSVVQIPQGIAYAVLAGLDPVVGLYISFFPPLFYMFFGTSRHNSVGAFAVVALMSRVAINQYSTLNPASHGLNGTMADDGTFYYPPAVVGSTLAFTVGLVHLAMAVLRLEFICTYFSDAVVSGFSTGAATHVFITQLNAFFGLKGLPERNGAGNLLWKLNDIIHALPVKINYVTTVVSVIAVVFLVAGKNYINPYVVKRFRLPVPIPFELLLIIFVTAASLVLRLNPDYKVAIVGSLPKGMPDAHLPAWELIPKLLPYAISISIVVAAIHISLAKMYSKKFGYKTDSGQEFYALGFTAFLSSLFPLYPICCSLGRTVVNVDAGTKTQFSSVFSSAIIAMLIFFIGPALRTLPMCILGVIIMVALTGMFRKAAELKTLWPISKYDFFTWVVSYVATVFWDVTPGLGIALSFALMTTVFRTQWPKWFQLMQLQGTDEFNARYEKISDNNGVCIFRFDAPILFTNVERFKNCVEKALNHWKEEKPRLIGPEDLQVKVVDKNKTIEQLNEVIRGKTPEEDWFKNIGYRHFIIDCSGFTFIDYMGVNALKEIYSDLHKQHCLVYFAAAKARVLDMFEECGFYKYVPKSNFYPTLRDAVQIAKKRRTQGTFYLLDQIGAKYDPVEEQFNIHTVT
uniref:STAS domain-containing protein n=1 Tax=Bursaphelenchus xylophilus TaxID=6326 RepID=A0A1I7RJJ6_BURXY